MVKVIKKINKKGPDENPAQLTLKYPNILL
jgi:hypothetical protein